MKKLLALTLTLALLTLTGCSVNNQSLYEQAQLYLGNHEYGYAAALFDQLGEYCDAGDYSLYAAALEALENGDLALARNTLSNLGSFKSVPRYLEYLDAEQLAADGKLDDALAAFEALGAFYHSQERAEDMRILRRRADLHEAELLLKAGSMEAAQAMIEPYANTEEGQELLASCHAAMQRIAYDDAQALYTDGRFLEAYDAFTALGTMTDAPIRAQLCRTALYRKAEEDYAQVTLSTSASLMAVYDKLSGYLNADARYEALADTFGTRLSLLDEADMHPFVTLGLAANVESSGVKPVMWRVLDVDENTATLVCCAVLTSRAAVTPTDLTMDLAVPEAFAEPVLSAPADWDLDADALLCMLDDTSALQAILTGDDSLCARWMTTLSDAGSAELCGCIPAGDGLGLRPIVRVSMADWGLTGGIGTWADPYR